MATVRSAARMAGRGASCLPVEGKEEEGVVVVAECE